MSDLRTAAQQALEALAIGQDAAYEVAQTYHEAMAGYRPARHIAVDDVRKIEDAIAALRAALAEPDRPTMTPKELAASIKRGEKWKVAEPVQEPVAHSVIAGALFDFMGWLTSRKERIVLSSADNASPAVEAITEFAKMRGLSLDDAKVQEWQEPVVKWDASAPLVVHLHPAFQITPPQRKPLTEEEIKQIALDTPIDGTNFARAVERAHGIGND